MYGVYVHVPWCRYRCPYCAFAIDTRSQPDDEGWLQGVRRDAERELAHFPGRPTTLHFGGGTPSRAAPWALAAVVREVGATGMVSLEANPDDITVESLRQWRDAGVGRLSVGVQSLDPAIAPALGRAHSSAQAERALELAMAAGFASVSADLIFGAAEQTPSQLARDVERLARLGLGHISLYALTIEPGTRFAERGRQEPPEERWLALQERAHAELERAGYSRYEVSNYARPGHRAEHNEHYWRARHWAGLGPAAHGWRPSGDRVANVHDYEAWIGGASPVIEAPTGASLAFELVWSTLRHIDGVDRKLVARRTHRPLVVSDALLQNGLVAADHDRITLEERGWAVADLIADRLVTDTWRRAASESTSA